MSEKLPGNNKGLKQVLLVGSVLFGTPAAFWLATQFRMPHVEEKLPTQELACDFPIKETRAKFGSTVLEIVEKQVEFGPGITAVDIINSGNVEGFNASTGGSSTYTMENAGMLSNDIIVRTPATCYWTKK